MPFLGLAKAALVVVDCVGLGMELVFYGAVVPNILHMCINYLYVILVIIWWHIGLLNAIIAYLTTTTAFRAVYCTWNASLQSAENLVVLEITSYALT